MSHTSALNLSSGFLKEQLCFKHLAYNEEGKIGDLRNHIFLPKFRQA
jgi:hypothetical protein